MLAIFSPEASSCELRLAKSEDNSAWRALSWFNASLALSKSSCVVAAYVLGIYGNTVAIERERHKRQAGTFNFLVVIFK